jgi:hypothetical protein
MGSAQMWMKIGPWGHELSPVVISLNIQWEYSIVTGRILISDIWSIMVESQVAFCPDQDIKSRAILPIPYNLEFLNFRGNL